MLEYICPQCGHSAPVYGPTGWRAREATAPGLVDARCPQCSYVHAGYTLYGLATRRNASQAIAHDVDCARAYLVACVERDAQRATDEYRAWATERTSLLMAHLAFLDYCHNDMRATRIARTVAGWVRMGERNARK